MQLCFLLPDFPCVPVMIAEVYYIGLVSASCCWLSRLMCLSTIKLSSAVKGSQHLITFWVCTPKPPPQERRRGSPWLAKCRWAQKFHAACSQVPVHVSVPICRFFFLPLSRNRCFIETLLYSVHMLLIYTTEIYQAQQTLYIWSCILAFATCCWICFVHWADLSRAVSQSRLSCPPSEGEAVSSLSLLPSLPCCSRCSGWS